MNIKFSFELKSELIAQMERENLFSQSNNQFWYPLSRPTYGIDEVLQALDSMAAFRTTMWDKTRQFEKAFSGYVGAESAMVNSGSSADLLLAFSLLKESGGPLSRGDEVLVPSVTWPTQLWSVAMAGFEPVLVDVDPKTLNMNLDDLVKKITKKTRAIFVVHLMGNPIDMDKVLDIAEHYGLLVLEDCCEALGSRWGENHVGSQSYGSSFSFFFSHHITTMEGGMIGCKNSELADRIRLLRAHGWSRGLQTIQSPYSTLLADSSLDSRYTFLEWGFNVRPTELQAGFGIEQLRKLPNYIEVRNHNFLMIKEIVEKLKIAAHLPEVGNLGRPSWFAVPLVLNEPLAGRRQQITQKLQSLGIETRPIVAGNLTKQPVKRRFKWLQNENLVGASKIHEQGFYFGLHPNDINVDIERLEDCLRKAFQD